MPPLSTTSESRLPELRGAAHRWISFWRGKFDRSSGTITLDRTAKTGSLDITIAASSVDFGHWQLNEHAKGPNLFDVSEFPTLRRAPIDPEREREACNPGRSIQDRVDTGPEESLPLTASGARGAPKTGGEGEPTGIHRTSRDRAADLQFTWIADRADPVRSSVIVPLERSNLPRQNEIPPMCGASKLGYV